LTKPKLPFFLCIFIHRKLLKQRLKINNGFVTNSYGRILLISATGKLDLRSR
jgi:hypothetical protein